MQYKLVFISGAASGLGKELAFQLANRHIPLLLTSKNKEELQLIEKELSPLTSVAILSADLSSIEGLNLVLQALEESTPDLIINNAGFGLYGDILSFSLEKQMNILKVNIDALVCISIKAAGLLKAQKKQGTIMNISSAASFFTYPSCTLYAASKRFVTEFSRSFDEELRTFNIRVLTVLPGRFHSNFQNRASGNKNVSFNSWEFMALSSTAEKILNQIEKQKPYQVIDFRYQILCGIARLLPRRWVAKRLQKTIQKTKKIST